MRCPSPICAWQQTGRKEEIRTKRKELEKERGKDNHGQIKTKVEGLGRILEAEHQGDQRVNSCFSRSGSCVASSYLGATGRGSTAGRGALFPAAVVGLFHFLLNEGDESVAATLELCRRAALNVPVEAKLRLVAQLVSGKEKERGEEGKDGR